MKKHLLSTVLVAIAVISAMEFIQPGATFAQGAATVPVYRFFSYSHYYSTSSALPYASWRSEGIAYYVSPVQLPYTVPLYHVFKFKLTDHFYTIDKGARDSLISQGGYEDRGIVGYVLPADKDLPGTAPLYRWVRVFKINTTAVQDHFYMTSASAVPDYTFEREECRVWTERQELPQRLIEIDTPAPGATLQIGSMPVISWRVWSNSGSIRLSYSLDNGASWRSFATVQNTGNYGDLNRQSYSNWKVPPEAAGDMIIKADLMPGGGFSLGDPNKPGPQPSGSVQPWATDMNGPLKVPANIRAPRIVPRLQR